MTTFISSIGMRNLCGAAAIALVAFSTSVQAQVGRFVGTYEGSAEVRSSDGTVRLRDMSVEIEDTKDGFTVSWTSVTYRPDGSSKAKSYTIDFVSSDRENVFAAAMKRNVFGHNVQLDPMKGEPYVWARVEGDMLSVYSIFVTESGGYEIQQFDRTLADGGLELDFRRVVNGEVKRTVSTFLKRK